MIENIDRCKIDRPDSSHLRPHRSDRHLVAELSQLPRPPASIAARGLVIFLACACAINSVTGYLAHFPPLSVFVILHLVYTIPQFDKSVKDNRLFLPIYFINHNILRLNPAWILYLDNRELGQRLEKGSFRIAKRR